MIEFDILCNGSMKIKYGQFVTAGLPHLIIILSSLVSVQIHETTKNDLNDGYVNIYTRMARSFSLSWSGSADLKNR